MKVWILQATASQADRPAVTFNVLAQSPDREMAITVATSEMEERGWSSVDIQRTGLLADDAHATAKDYLKRAIADAQAYGFAFVRYGPQDN